MAFDQATRNRLARFVSDARALLSEEFTRQLQNDYGMDPTRGDVADLEKLTHLDDARRQTAQLVRDTLEYYLASSSQTTKAKQEALDRIVREQAFTVLNRLSAIRMAEARGLIIESVAKGYQSKGFQLYARLAGTALGETGDAYRYYLFSLFDELALDLPVLFDRFNPQGRLFPREAVLLQLLELINHADIDTFWAEDETIGWIYQYFNSKEERKAMRDASQAPRNSRELAVRNQFFTPRYVVEFLTDNTLGRIWFEMTKGDTGLKDSCRYLVRRPNEIFLAPGEVPPAGEEQGADLSQEELLKQPVHIPHRPLKDPRDLKMLDPACGSMHFGLYAFDLFERIYEEAWDIESTLGPDAFTRPEGLEPLHDTFENKDAFLKDVPRLIIERNIHGIDIDPRAVQIAGLSLWLRAQKTWQAKGLKPQDRPQIRRSNIVTAEPMLGERGMLEDFLKTLHDTRLEDLIRRVMNVPEGQQVRATPTMANALAELVRTVWKEMELAGEAGSLLKIEESLSDAIAKGKAEWDVPLFRITEFGLAEAATDKPKVRYTKSLPGEETDFWDIAEVLVLTALEEYAERADNGGGYQRRLFAEDAARGFAFIDICRKLFDACVMNPPFGEFSTQWRNTAAVKYEDSKSDIGFSMITRGLDLTAVDGYTGAIVSRLFIVNDGVAKWREQQLLSERSIECMADLGYGVLDDAMVEVSSLCIRKQASRVERPVFFLKVLDERDKGIAVESFFSGKSLSRTFTYLVMPSYFKAFNKSLLCYWLPARLAALIKNNEGLKETGGNAHFGASTSDDFQFARLRWEVGAGDLQARSWVPFAKGGEYSPFFDDISLLLEWHEDGRRLKEYVDRKSFETQGGGGWTRWINGVEFYFKEGLTYPERTTSDLCPQVLPRDCLFSAIGSAIHFSNTDMALSYLGAAFTRPFKILADAIVGSGDSSVSGSAARHYRPGIVNSLPAPGGLLDRREIERVIACVDHVRAGRRSDETSWEFDGTCFNLIDNNLFSWIVAEEHRYLDSAVQVIDLCAEVENAITRNLGLSEHDLTIIEAEFGPHPASYPRSHLEEFCDSINEAWAVDENTIVEKAVVSLGARRQLTKKSYFGDRRLELIAHTFRLHPAIVVSALADSSIHSEKNSQQRVQDLLSYCIGCVFGRWDIRFATGPSISPPTLDVFAPLPVCPPGQLQNSQGLPLTQEEVAQLKAKTLWDYPIEPVWNGILVDDPSHLLDIETCINRALRIICGEQHEGIEDEACAILGVRSLRNYFSKPSSFFLEHLKRYSKSRRQAPIYWPLSTPSGSYTLWLYYHRLTDQTLYTCVNDFVDPKLKRVTEDVNALRQKSRRSSAEEKELERLSGLEAELKDFRDELLRIARFWKPNLNDGVQITAAPLWKLFQHRPWQKRLKEAWEKLEAGDYDWAHLAYSIWPERVKEKCKSDKSLAIAHDLEGLYVEPPAKAKKGRGRKSEQPDLGMDYDA